MENRREHVPFDPYHFERQSRGGARRSIAETFQYIYQANHWSGGESVSGEGASVEQTRQLQTELPALLRELRVDVLLDLPCGDFGWMKDIDLPVSRYIGADIVPELIRLNQQQYAGPARRFEVIDMTRDALPAADLLLCRDCWVHLSFADIHRALANLKQSSIRYLLTTTFVAGQKNEDITTGDWRVLNLELPPFNFPPPLQLIDERCTEGNGNFQDKRLALWSVASLSL